MKTTTPIFAAARWVGLIAAALLAGGIAPAQEEAPPGGSITGLVFEDSDGDANMDKDEVGGAGIIVDLLDADGRFVARAVTNVEGKYAFEGLADGVYFLRFEFKVGYAVRSVGVSVSGNEVAFSPIPIITPLSSYNFFRLGLINPANVTGNEVSAFQPGS